MYMVQSIRKRDTNHYSEGTSASRETRVCTLSGDAMISSINPTNGETLETFAPHDDAQADAVLDQAVEQSQRWRNSTIETRASVLRQVAKVLTDSKTSLASTMTLEMGKTFIA